MTVRAGMIVGFDHDDNGIFDQQFEFIQEANISLPSVSILTAIPGTRLWERLQGEGRIVKMDAGGYATGSLTTTNIAFLGMTFNELYAGYIGLISRLADWHNFETRITKMLSGIRRKPNLHGRKRQWKRVFQVVRFLLSQDKETRRSIIRIIMHTRRHAPFMLEKVVGLIIQFCGLTNLVLLMKKDAQKQIELSKSGAFQPETDNTHAVIPEAFKGVYQEIFAEIHQRVYQSLIDKRLTEETLVAIFVDFINSQEDGYDSFTDHHKVILHNFAENRVAEENRGTSAVPISDFSVPDIKKTLLAEEILKAIEQELRIAGKYYGEVKR